MKTPEEHVLFCSRVGEDAVEYRATNVHGACAKCQTPIVWRPNVPAHFTKVCASCGLKMAGKASMEEMLERQEIKIHAGQRRELEELLTSTNPLNPVAVWIQQLLDKTKGNC